MLLLTLGLACAAPVAAADAVNEELVEEAQYVVGATLVSAPEYAGSDRRELKPQYLWGVRWGRLRISTSKAGAMLGYGGGISGPGASAEVLHTDRWKLGIALRFDNGRSSGDSPYLAGLSDIRRTLRGRVLTSYTVNKHWNVGANVSQDLLGRAGGVQAGLDLGYRDWLTPETEWTAGVGVALANGQHMRTYFGITEAQAAASGRTAYRPPAGLRDVHAGLGITTTLTPNWIGFAGAGYTVLMAGASDSPLTRQSTSLGASVGIAYRCCR